MKKSKLKAKIDKLEFKNKQLLEDNSGLIKDKLKLKSDIYELIDHPDSKESANIRINHIATRNYLKDRARLLLFGSTNTKFNGTLGQSIFPVVNKLSESQGFKISCE